MRRWAICTFACCLCVVLPPAALAQSPDVVVWGERASVPDKLLPVQFRQCSRRVGPFATQTTAWQRWRQARGSGYAVSQGVVPCYGGGGRGYCFNVFYRC